MRVRNLLLPLKYDEKDIYINTDLSISTTIQEIINSFKITYQVDKIKLSLKQYNNKSINQDLFNLDKAKSLKDYNITENDILQLEFSNIILFNARITIALSYLFPILIFFGFAIKLYLKYNLTYIQIIILLMNTLHYSKRFVESLIDIRGNDNMNLVPAFGVCFYYWVIYGVLIGYNVFHHEYDNSGLLNFNLQVCCIIGFLFSEYFNYEAHCILRNLKVVNKGKRGIPQGGMFYFISCSNYFWESMIWFFFSLYVNILPAYLFVIYSVVNMSYGALEKHKTYTNNFENYPKNRKAIIPFIL